MKSEIELLNVRIEHEIQEFIEIIRTKLYTSPDYKIAQRKILIEKKGHYHKNHIWDIKAKDLLKNGKIGELFLCFEYLDEKIRIPIKYIKKRPIKDGTDTMGIFINATTNQ